MENRIGNPYPFSPLLRQIDLHPTLHLLHSLQRRLIPGKVHLRLLLHYGLHGLVLVGRVLNPFEIAEEIGGLLRSQCGIVHLLLQRTEMCRET